MHFKENFWASLTSIVGFFTLAPFREPGIQEQTPLGLEGLEKPFVQNPDTIFADQPGPIFKPPGGAATGDGSDFFCNYTQMINWGECSTSDNRTCWLVKNTGERFDINTDYEKNGPTGVERYYELDITDDTSINLDGVFFRGAKLFDRKYPGPWIQACWGDTVTVKINNWMKFNGGNGTSIHWHGIRQLNTTHMDGVNGITQCPIAPSDSFTYSWKVQQYGTSWYHSHYSVQYADGLLGPLTLHGPAIMPYDEAVDPLFMTDWGHNSAFESIQTGNFGNPSILLNGRGNATRYNSTLTPLAVTSNIPTPFTIYFDPKPVNNRAKRYLLRLINTSFASSFIFSIDNHTLNPVGADFVPIHNYSTKSVMVAIGQRYHVVVQAEVDPNGKPIGDDNFWIRAKQAGCTDFNQNQQDGGDRVGILRYTKSTTEPTSTAWNVTLNCTDEVYTNLVPVVPWTIGPPANDPVNKVGENLTLQFSPTSSDIFPLAKFSLGGDTFNPMYVNYGDPIFLNLNYSGKWDPLWVVFPENHFTDKDWVYFVIKSPGAHPAPKSPTPKDTSSTTPTPRRRHAPTKRRQCRHRLQNRQPGDMDHALPHRLPRVVRTCDPDPGASGCREDDLAELSEVGAAEGGAKGV
ncbi:uncharacterized protein KY384_000518 [Bacidia gigantensis]|uniref:uncharacterized protein n=1 Tax=Bacidia gigantensis TaxID=2732470 RepID=UPI001D057A7E|nr:uncharacterized protein KY384_000518 [Bacidia gigantensis]KAG8525758.1 hypothetical protein KY384_000518 [Bacidia gigantensis]